MLRCKSCLKRMETNKAESKDATQDKVDDFNEDTCNVSLTIKILWSAWSAVNTEVSLS